MKNLKKSHITFFKIKIMVIVENLLDSVSGKVTDEDAIM